MTGPAPVRVLIASYLEPHLVDRIRALDSRIAVTYRADLVGRPRYPGDHTAPMTRSPAQDAEWDRLVAAAEVMFDAYRPRSDDLPRRAPRLRWIQFSSSGVAGFIHSMGLGPADILVTNAAGIHARALAEFVLFAMLYFAKRLPRVLADQRARRWERFALDTLPGKTLGVVGLGRVGDEVKRLAQALGVRVVATRRSAEAARPGLGETYPPDELPRLLAESDYVALTVPLTPDTTGLIGEAELAMMKPGAVLINVARGQVVDEPALVRALREARLGGAALDVFTVEPLPPDSPLWDLPNVLVTPHSMSTALDENERVVDLFCDNLARYLAGAPLRNVFDHARGY
jgi:phosphoglycerate dehydrogenase-like enzyme